jgi:hypothetical protein
MIARARSASGLTLIQLLYWTLIVMGLTMLMYPLFLQDNRGGPRSNCMSNLKQLGLAVLMYTQDYDESYPVSYSAKDGPLPCTQGDARAATARSPQWVDQLLPYVKNRSVLACSKDVNPKRSLIHPMPPGSAAPFPVSYGPNRMFVDPKAYGWKKRVLQTTDVADPAATYLLGDCVTAHGFDLEDVAYLRYPNYDPSLRQNGWDLQQFRAAGRVAWPDQLAERITRHQCGSIVVFVDGHAAWLRHDRIPNHDGPNGSQFQALKAVMVPWQAVHQ